MHDCECSLPTGIHEKLDKSQNLKGENLCLKWSKGKIAMFFITLVSLNVIVMMDLAIVPVIGSIYEAFSEQTGAVNVFLSIPAIIAMFSFLTPFIVKLTGKKNLIIICAALYAASTIFGAAIENIYYMIVVRFVAGLAYGLVNVLYVMIIADVFVDETKRTSFMGIYMGLQAGIGSLMSFFSGILAQRGWRNSYHLFWISIPVLILCIFFLPSDKETAAANPAAAAPAEIVDKKSKSKGSYGGRFIELMGILLIMQILYYVCFQFVSVYVEENALGTTALTGIVSSGQTIASAILCFTIGIVYRKFKAKTGSLLLLLFAAGMLLMYFVRTPGTAIAGAAMMGGAYGAFFAWLLAYLPNIVAAEKVEMAISVATTVCFVGMFLTPYLVQPLITVLGGVSPIYLYGGIISTVMVVLEFMASFKSKVKA